MFAPLRFLIRLFARGAMLTNLMSKFSCLQHLLVSRRNAPHALIATGYGAICRWVVCLNLQRVIGGMCLRLWLGDFIHQRLRPVPLELATTPQRRPQERAMMFDESILVGERLLEGGLVVVNKEVEEEEEECVSNSSNMVAAEREMHVFTLMGNQRRCGNRPSQLMVADE